MMKLTTKLSHRWIKMKIPITGIASYTWPLRVTVPIAASEP